MSNRALTWAFESGLPSGQRFVLVALADHASDHSGEDWTCFPSVARIREMTGQGGSTIERHISWLWSEGWLSRERRRRPDGSLGINDYVLHRDPETRAALKAERTGQSAEQVSQPALDMRDGPALDLAATSPRIDGQPALDLRAHEPSLEPLEEPSQRRAGEPGDEGFEGAVAIWPESGLKRTNFPVARARWAKAAQQIGLLELQRRTADCATDPQFAKGDHGWPALDNWLVREGWRAYPAAGEERPASARPRTHFAGPAALREAVVNARGEDFAAAYLDRSAWLDGVLTAWSARAFEKLVELRTLLAQHGAELRPNGGTHERAA